MFDIYSLKNYNFRIIIYALSLSILGVLVINSATYDAKVVNRQIVGIIFSLLFMFILSNFFSENFVVLHFAIRR